MRDACPPARLHSNTGCAARERALRDVARAREPRAADRIELEAAFARIGDDDDRAARLRRLDRRIRVVREPAEDREERQRGDQAADHDLRLAAEAVGEPADQEIERRRRRQRRTRPAGSTSPRSTFSVCVRNSFM